MAENEANVKISVDDSDLLTTSRRLEGVENNLESLAREGRQASTSLRGVGRAALGAIGGLVSLEAAKQALTSTINVLRASIEAYAESSEEGRRTVDAVSSSINSMKAALGEAIIGGDNAQVVVESLNETFDKLRQYIDDNSEAIAQLTVDGLELFGETVEKTLVLIDDLRVIFAGLNHVLSDTDTALGRVVGVLQEAERQINLTGRAFRFLRDQAEAVLPPIEEGSFRFMHLEQAADGASNSVLNYASSLVEAARISSEVFGAASDIGVPEPPRRRGRRDDSEECKLALQEEFFAAEREAQKTQQQQMMELLAEQEQARIDLIAQAAKAEEIEQSLIREKEFEAQMSHLVRMAEMEKAMRDQAGAQKLAGQEKLEADLAAQREKWTKFGQDAASTASRLALAASVGSAKERKKALKQALGQELITKGGALVATGIGNAIALNPKGALEIAGGVSMIAAGAKLAGGGGGGGGGKGAKTPPTNSTPASATNNTQNVVINQNTSFGFVGDRRAATREIEQINERSIERGLAPA